MKGGREMTLAVRWNKEQEKADSKKELRRISRERSLKV